VRWLFGLLLIGATLLAGMPPGLQAADQLTPPSGLALPNPAASMPAFELPTPQGDTFRSAALQGKVVVIRFWATW
jgi:cytochrome oxidase Cu insertion factor (SCO1/SenC/PrrC family)